MKTTSLRGYVILVFCIFNFIAPVRLQNGGTNSSNPDCDDVCVIYYLCNENRTVITDGATILDSRLKGTCTNENEVCCRLENVIQQPKNQQNHSFSISGQNTCGIQNAKSNNTGTDGKRMDALFGEYPWMVAITYRKKLENNKQAIVYQGGGSLIHPKVIVTAAHTIFELKNDNTLYALIGEWDPHSKNERLPHQVREISSFVIHPEFQRNSLFNDIALLFFDTPVEYADNVGTICIPSVHDIAPADCFVSGWGKDKFGKTGTASAVMKSIKLPIVKRNACQTALRNTRLGTHFLLDKTFICAGGEQGKDSCQKDGGSPLVCPVPGHSKRYFQAGIVAWGIGCGEQDIPGVYANVPYFRKWIDEQMKQKNLDTSSYAI